jgi:hypothetical protein
MILHLVSRRLAQEISRSPKSPPGPQYLSCDVFTDAMIDESREGGNPMVA